MKLAWLPVFVLSVLAGVGLQQVYAEKNPTLPPPYETPSKENPSTVIGWPAGKTPIAPAGFNVSVFAELDTPRLLYVLPSGDVLVSQAKKRPDDQGQDSPNQITFFKMNGSELVSQKVLIKDLNLPFGMAVWKDELLIGEPEQVLSFPFDGNEVKGAGRVIATLPFPEPKRHWTRHLLLSEDGSKLYVSVGSVSNVGEAPDPLNPKTAAILQMNRDGSSEKIYAGGLRNAVSMAWEPTTGKLWTVVNERDELGDLVPPDYLTHVEEDGFYGWPYAYWGKNEDPRRKGERPDLVEKSITPDFSVGAHTASLGLTFTTGTKVSAPFDQGALISQHGSWNSSTLVGYKIIYVPFVNGAAVDGEKDFLTGFIADLATSTVYGRPVSTVVLADGTILVADDGGGKIWKVSPVK
ncbi:PQQ-dependent sugar dehydrogenase [Bdellovibrio sp. HCB337]|uniref:PQQ-dependent sugar dehydrogenase n=1 Tax=Bdellovibrio sp. HCB337 TaxID=3394358 RepID=UPI0039A6CB22